MVLLKAKRLADRVFEILQPHCVIINIAGSIRREKAEVKDIEIVCIPKLQPSGLFGDESVIDKGFVEAVESFTGKVAKGAIGGRYMKIILKGTDMALDLFMPVANDYYRQLAIRTGSADFSQKVIATGWVRKGWIGIKDIGLRKQVDCTNLRKPGAKTDVWVCNKPDAELPPVWESEEDFFNWIGVKYLPPKYRF